MLLKKLFSLVLVASFLACPPVVLAQKTVSKKVNRDTSPEVNVVQVSKISEVETIVGRASIARLAAAAERVAVGDPKIADFTIISPKELYVLGKAVGITNLIYWDARGRSYMMNVVVSVDVEPLARTVKDALPNETNIKITSAANSIVLMGDVSNALAAEATANLADAYSRNINRSLTLSGSGGSSSSASPASTGVSYSVGAAGTLGGGGASTGTGTNFNAQVINLLKVRDPQQVMLEVRIAEVSKVLLEKIGVSFIGSSALNGTGLNWVVPESTANGGLIGKIFEGAFGAKIDLEKNDGLVKILAAPTIIAVSGQEGSFLVGGKVFLPVQSVSSGLATVTLQEQDYGVGLKFVPTVLDKGRINLKVAPEVSELSKEPVTVVSSGTTTVLPTFITRKVSTTVQLGHGQSLVIGGLLRNNVVETVRSIPGLGQLPILGPLFRSSEFATDKTELIIFVRPTLVEGTDKSPTLPTDNFIQPSRGEFFFEGKMEGQPPASAQPNKPLSASPAATLPQ